MLDRGTGTDPLVAVAVHLIVHHHNNYQDADRAAIADQRDGHSTATVIDADASAAMVDCDLDHVNVAVMDHGVNCADYLKWY